MVTIIVPLRPAVREVRPRFIAGGTAYFLLIGVGFMMVEIGLYQRSAAGVLAAGAAAILGLAWGVSLTLTVGALCYATLIPAATLVEFAPRKRESGPDAP